MSIFKLKATDSRARFHGKWIKDGTGTNYFMGYNGDGTYTANTQRGEGEWVIVNSSVDIKEIMFHIEEGNWTIHDDPDQS